MHCITFKSICSIIYILHKAVDIYAFIGPMRIAISLRHTVGFLPYKPLPVSISHGNAPVWGAPALMYVGAFSVDNKAREKA